MSNTPNKSEPVDRNKLVVEVNREYHKKLYLYAQGLCRNFKVDPSYADDIMQEVYTKILHGSVQSALRIKKDGISYLCVMAKNVALDLERKRKSLKRVGEIQAENQPSFANIYYQCAEVHIEEFLSSISYFLKPEDLAIMKWYAYGYSHKEIAEKMNMNFKTVGVRISRAKEKLRPFFDDRRA